MKFSVGDEVVEVDGDRVGEVMSIQGESRYRVTWRGSDEPELARGDELRLASDVGSEDEIAALEPEYEPPSDDFRDIETEYIGDGFSQDMEYDGIEAEPVATCNESTEVAEEVADLMATNQEMELKLIECLTALEETARHLPDCVAKTAADQIADEIHEYFGRGVSYTLPRMAAAAPSQRWEVVRLVHELHGPYYDGEENDELAEYLNDGWQVVAIDSTTVAGVTQTIFFHFQVVTLKRWVSEDDDLRYDEAEDEDDLPGVDLREPDLADRLDTPADEKPGEAGPEALLTAPEGWLSDCREAVQELRRRQLLRDIGNELRSLGGA